MDAFIHPGPEEFDESPPEENSPESAVFDLEAADVELPPDDGTTLFDDLDREPDDAFADVELPPDDGTTLFDDLEAEPRDDGVAGLEASAVELPPDDGSTLFDDLEGEPDDAFADVELPPDDGTTLFDDLEAEPHNYEVDPSRLHGDIWEREEQAIRQWADNVPGGPDAYLDRVRARMGWEQDAAPAEKAAAAGPVDANDVQAANVTLPPDDGTTLFDDLEAEPQDEVADGELPPDDGTTLFDDLESESDETLEDPGSAAGEPLLEPEENAATAEGPPVDSPGAAVQDVPQAEETSSPEAQGPEKPTLEEPTDPGEQLVDKASLTDEANQVPAATEAEPEEAAVKKPNAFDSSYAPDLPEPEADSQIEERALEDRHHRTVKYAVEKAEVNQPSKKGYDKIAGAIGEGAYLDTNGGSINLVHDLNETLGNHNPVFDVANSTEMASVKTFVTGNTSPLGNYASSLREMIGEKNPQKLDGVADSLWEMQSTDPERWAQVRATLPETVTNADSREAMKDALIQDAVMRVPADQVDDIRDYVLRNAPKNPAKYGIDADLSKEEIAVQAGMLAQKVKPLADGLTASDLRHMTAEAFREKFPHANVKRYQRRND